MIPNLCTQVENIFQSRISHYITYDNICGRICYEHVVPVIGIFDSLECIKILNL